MTTKSHQPEFVAEIIGKTLDHLIDDRKRVAVNFELAENGCMEETHVSLKRRIATMWGFQTSFWRRARPGSSSAACSSTSTAPCSSA